MTNQANRPSDVVVPRQKEAVQTRRLPPYQVILENDDYHSFDFVIEVLGKTFGFHEQKATLFAVEAHRSGRAVVWTGSKEVAELKVEQATSIHEIRSDGTQLGPVLVVIEPAPQ